MASEKQPGQFGILALFVLITLAGISVAVVSLPVPASEKIASLMVLWLCLACWRKRNYLHPQQATISFASRRRLAVLDFVGSLWWLPLFIWIYAATAWKADRPVFFSDVVFFGAVLMHVAIATWKLTRALLPSQVWRNPEWV
jgi:hypothetical protein